MKGLLMAFSTSSLLQCSSSVWGLLSRRLLFLCKYLPCSVYTDDIDFGDSRPSVKNALGGAASFAAVGARLVAGRTHARSVSWIVDVGSDFPPEVLDVIKSWDTNCVIREDKTRLTTRAWNGYGLNEKRGWYLS